MDGFENNQPEDLIYGRNAVSELLKSGKTVDRVYIQSGNRDGSLAVIRALTLKNKIPLVETDARKLDKMCQGGVHQGVAAQPSQTDFLSVGELIESTLQKGQKPFFVVCDGINDPHNLGAVIRSAECAGANGVIIPKRNSAGMSATVAKSSAGAVFRVPVARVSNIALAVRELKKNNIWVWALEAGGTEYYNSDLTGALALVLGSEGDGVSDIVKKESDFVIGIPMYGALNSLNVSAAAAIVLFEAAKRRNEKK